jgi:hypothetical protein
MKHDLILTTMSESIDYYVITHRQLFKFDMARMAICYSDWHNIILAIHIIK